MAYLDAYLQPCPGFGWQGGPEFKTRIVEMRNGRERRNADIANARHGFSVPYRNIPKADYAQVKQMHLVARGMLHAFKFRDELDYQAVGEVFGEGDGVATVFQLRKVSTVDSVSYIRETYVISDDFVPVLETNGSPAGAHSIDAERGLVTYSVAPAAAAVLSGTWNFDLWVRFNQDNLPFSIDQVRDYASGTLNLIELPPPPLP